MSQDPGTLIGLCIRCCVVRVWTCSKLYGLPASVEQCLRRSRSIVGEQLDALVTSVREIQVLHIYNIAHAHARQTDCYAGDIIMGNEHESQDSRSDVDVRTEGSGFVHSDGAQVVSATAGTLERDNAPRGRQSQARRRRGPR